MKGILNYDLTTTAKVDCSVLAGVGLWFSEWGVQVGKW